METIQVVLDKELLRTANREAKRKKINRSALVRDALREYLKQVETHTKAEQDRLGYLKIPDAPVDADWEAEAAWPEE